MASYHRVIGIDLGTTFSVVAAYSFDKQDIVVIPNRLNESTTPSVVFIGVDGKVAVGKSAKQKQLRHPQGVLVEVKRMMGEKNADGSHKMVKLRSRQYYPEQISAYILKELKSCAEKMIGEPVHDAVITVPAYFKESQKNATHEAAKIAGLNPRLIINEPTAAAVAYGLESDEDDPIFIIYDFGGGTFDVSIVRVIDEVDTVEVLGTGGDAHLGGGDIDQLLVDWFLKNLAHQVGHDIQPDDKLIGKLRLRAEQIKIDLCNEQSDQEFFVEHPVRGLEEASYILTVAEFNSLVNPLIERTLTEIDVAIASAAQNHALSMDDVDAFILVGGSSKNPFVVEKLKARYKKPVKMDLNPDEIVAIGAATVAKNYSPSKAVEIKDGAQLEIEENANGEEQLTSTNIKDVVSHTLGVGLKDDVYDPLIPKDSVIPHSVVRGGYTTAEDNQTSIYVPVYQGDHAQASVNHKLGSVVIDNLTPEPKGFHKFEITFALDMDGIFTGQVKHSQTNRTMPITLDRGQDALTEKKRIELAEVVNQGVIGSGTTAVPENQSGSQDKVEQLITKARAAINSLPVSKRQEVEATLNQLIADKEVGNHEGVGAAVINLTMLLIDIPAE